MNFYKLLDHESDIGIQGIGFTLEEAFEEGAKALYSIMVDLKCVEQKETVAIECDAPDVATLFVEWLNKLLSKSDYFFSDFKVEQIKNNKLAGRAFGEKIDLSKHGIKTEAKAATYSGLKVEKAGNKFIAQCVVDV